MKSVVSKMSFKTCIYLALILFFQTGQIQSKKILCLLGVGSETAQEWNKVLLNELSARGNELTVVTPVLSNAETEPNIEFIYLENGMKLLKSDSKTETVFPNILQQSILMATLNWYGEQMAACQGILYSKGFSEILNMALAEKHPFDMIIFDVTHGPGCLLRLVDLFDGIPIVGLTSSTLSSAILNINQNSILNAAFDPFFLSDFDRNMNYWTRIYNTILYGFDYICHQWLVKPVLEGLWSNYMNDNEIFVKPTTNDWRKRFKVILANHHPTLHTLASLPYNVIPVPGLHIKTYHNTTTPPANELSKFKENFSKGIVLINLELEQLGDFNVQTVLAVVRKFSKYGFIWKAGKTDNFLPNKPKNLMLETKLDNQEILNLLKADNKIKSVLTTPDILRIQECLFHGIPIITLTLTPEQGYLAQRLKEQEVALNLQLSELPKLASVLESALANDVLQNTALQLQKSLANPQNSPLDTAVWWVEQLLGNPAANDYIYTARKNSYGFFAPTSLDILLFFEVFILLCLVNTIWICKQTVCNFRKKKSGQKIESKIKKQKKEKEKKTKPKTS